MKVFDTKKTEKRFVKLVGAYPSNIPSNSIQESREKKIYITRS